MMQMSISTNDGFLAATSTEEGLLAAGVIGALEKKKDIMEKKKDIMRKKWAVRGGLLALGAIAPAVWLVGAPFHPRQVPSRRMAELGGSGRSGGAGSFA
jgi:hypothetical protein